jgi:hypothetical protein
MEIDMSKPLRITVLAAGGTAATAYLAWFWTTLFAAAAAILAALV